MANLAVMNALAGAGQGLLKNLDRRDAQRRQAMLDAAAATKATKEDEYRNNILNEQIRRTKISEENAKRDDQLRALTKQAMISKNKDVAAAVVNQNQIARSLAEFDFKVDTAKSERDRLKQTLADAGMSKREDIVYLAQETTSGTTSEEQKRSIETAKAYLAAESNLSSLELQNDAAKTSAKIYSTDFLGFQKDFKTRSENKILSYELGRKGEKAAAKALETETNDILNKLFGGEETEKTDEAKPAMTTLDRFKNVGASVTKDILGIAPNGNEPEFLGKDSGVRRLLDFFGGAPSGMIGGDMPLDDVNDPLLRR